MKVYISGALMSATNLEENRKLYTEIADLCLRSNFQPYLPHLSSDPTKHFRLSDEMVFNKDLHNLIDSEIIIAYLDDPSLGVGAEIAIAKNKNKIIIGIHKDQNQISRFIIGLIESSPNSFLINYSSKQELSQKIEKTLETVSTSLIQSV